MVNREKVYVLGVTRGVCSLAESEGPGERNRPPIIPWLPFPGGALLLLLSNSQFIDKESCLDLATPPEALVDTVLRAETEAVTER